jgi:hypothetical protein
MSRMVTSLWWAALLALLPVWALAQTPPAPASLATPTGNEVSAGAGGYRYVEPLAQPISIQGPKFVAEYTGTRSLSPRRRWFLQANARGVVGNMTYDGFCRPWLIVPNRSSPNGYALGLGGSSPCGESGDADWYVEGRALVGKDFVGAAWGLSPFTGLGLRHLSNGTAGIPGYRTDDYLYVPVGLTTRTRVAARVLSVSLEYDRLLHGWQHTHESRFRGGTVPATGTAPAFTIDGFTDVSFSQHSGWALRASATYQATRRWSLEPYYIRWSVRSSPVNDITATFTVNGITAHEQLGFYEPFNTTNELGVKLGFRF